MGNPFEAPGFKGDVRHFKDPDEGGNGFAKFAMVIIIIIVGFVCLFLYLRGNESYSSKYEIDRSDKQVDIEIKGGSRVYFAPFDDETMNTDIGLVPTMIQVSGLHLYEARFIPRSVDDGHFIGIRSEALEQFDEEYLSLFMDKDGVVWIHTSQIEIIPPDVP